MPDEAPEEEGSPPHDPVDDHPLPPSRPFLIALVVILLFLALWLTKPYLGAVVLALLVAFLLHPVHTRLVRLVRKPTISSIILLFAVGLLLVAPFAFVIWQTYGQLQMLITLAQDPARVQAEIQEILRPFGFSEEEVSRLIADAGQKIASFAAAQILPTLLFLFHLLIALVVFFFVLFFAIRDGADWVEKMKGYTPLPEDDKDDLYKGATASIWAIVMGTFVVAALQGIVAGIGWWIFGFPEPLFWGFIMVVVGIFPFGAPFLITIPASIIALINGDYVAGIGLFVYTVTVVALTDDLLRPLLVGKKAHVHPVLILVGMLGGIAVFGVAGFLLGPLIFALLGPVMDVWSHRRKELADHDGTRVPGIG